MDKTKKLYGKRTFLEPLTHVAHVDSLVVGTIYLETWGTENETSKHLNATLSLGDCMRAISWGFYLSQNDNASERRRILRKAHVARKAINEFFDALEAEIAEF